MLDSNENAGDENPLDALRGYIQIHKLSERSLSKLCGISTSTLNGILRMKRRPSASVAVRLEQQTGVSAEKLIMYWEKLKIRQEIGQVLSGQRQLG